MKPQTFAAVLLAVTLAACNRAPQLETRTFSVNQLAPYEVEQLIAPYVYADRPGQPGTMSTSERAVTVRESPDNLEKIERVLAEYDKARPDIRLTFQVIEADGFTDRDPRIADVEQELRELFQFKGYRLAAEAMLSVTDGSPIQQTLSGSDGVYQLSGDVSWASGGATQLKEMQLWQNRNDILLRTSVAIRPGQTLVLGTAPKKGSTATLLLTVHAESVEG